MRHFFIIYLFYFIHVNGLQNINEHNLEDGKIVKRNVNNTVDNDEFDSFGNEFSTIWNKRQLNVGRFSRPTPDDRKWLAYFYEETIVPVLQTSNKLIIDCVVIEVRQDNEQRQALFDLGLYMELVPLRFKDMIIMVERCGLLNSPEYKAPTIVKAVDRIDSLDDLRGAVLLPGTLWCGMSDRADKYEFLGEETTVDICCRNHDHCPVKVGAMESRYSTYNFGITTRSHCLCDAHFYSCLKESNDRTANGIGNIFFNILRVQCLNSDLNSEIHGSPSQIYKCTKRDANNGCRMWTKNKHFQIKGSFKRFPERY